MPSFYPVNVTRVYGVNNKEDWTVLIHNFMTFVSDSDISYIHQIFPDYDGFGLPHALGITSRSQIGVGTTQLPDTLYMYWVSLFDTKFYVTKYEIPDNVKQLVATKKLILNGMDLLLIHVIAQSLFLVFCLMGKLRCG